MNNRTREVTTKLIEMCEEGNLDPMTVLRDVLNWMSEDEVAEFAEDNGYISSEDDEDEDDQGFEVGDRVVDGYGDVGVVVEIDEDADTYPIVVNFNGGIFTFTKSGVFDIISPNDVDLKIKKI